jgi:pyruvate/2-oxoglutarate dehydrogenase complex dihydrolipoamide dehydrogenase (E3) component
MDEFDAIVVGAGQAGVPLARDLAAAGWKTALVERAHVGGTCYNEGCTPTKTMAASARVAYLAGRAWDYGVVAGPVHTELAEVRRRKDRLVDDWRSGAQRRLEATHGLELIWGQARFVHPHGLAVQLRDGSERRIQAPSIFLNTGARPSVPALPGLESVPFLDSTTIMDLDAIPERLLVLGGGYVAVEFGQMFRRFGSRVTIIQRSGALLSREDQDVADAVAAILREDGIDVLLETRAASVREAAGGSLVLEVESGPTRHTVSGSHLLVAAGRVPNTEGLDLGTAGIAVDAHGFIKANDRLETDAPGVYALGDVNGGPAFTHVSYDDYRIIRTNLLRGGNASTAGRLVPYTVFMDPQLGRVGLTEERALADGLDVQVFKVRMDQVARALEVDESRGFIKAVAEAGSGRILGCAVLGIDGGELMAMLEIAIMGAVTVATLRDAIFAHPTLAEALNNLFSAA